MSLTALFDLSLRVSCPPQGAVNVRLGQPVEGPGGRWVPCATAVEAGVYVASIYQVGPGRRQVCATNQRTNCATEALSYATSLAWTASA